MGMPFTEDEIALAKTADLVSIASSLGYTPKKIGRFYTLKEMDSIRIYNRHNWFRWSRKDEKGHNGGSQIDFLREFAGLGFKDAVKWLLDYIGYVKDENISRDKSENSDSNIFAKKNAVLFRNTLNQVSKDVPEKKEFILPTASADNTILYEYLNKVRGISVSTIDFFVNKGLIYETSIHHNVVFIGQDSTGYIRFASMRGTRDIPGKKPFKIDVEGNDKHYGFNLTVPDSDSLVVFEAAIDLMSFVDIFQEYDTNMLALGMTSDVPLETYLKEHPNIKSISLCLDNDEPGRKATESIMQRYKAKGYDVKDIPAPSGYKDINEWLVSTKLFMDTVSERNYRNAIGKKL